LTVEWVAGQSVVTSAWAATPLTLLTPRPAGAYVQACLGNHGGGLVAGDEIRLALRVGAGAMCHLGTQASTKVYRNPLGLPCGQRVSARVESCAMLAFLPDPVQPFAGSEYLQEQEFELEVDANLVLVDWLSAGRVARGERWSFSRFQSRNRVSVAGRLAWWDSLRLDPADGKLAGVARLGRFNCLALALLMGPKLERAAANLLSRVGGQPVRSRAMLVTAASPLPGGVLLRLVGESTERVECEIREQLAEAMASFHDDPWGRQGWGD